jgi:hypothetical protein
MPPQWQGSEDILVPPEGELEGEDAAEEEEEEPFEGEVDGEGGEESSVSRNVVEDSEDELAL